MNREELAARILDAFPTGEYGLLALLHVMDVVPSAEVETAAVECTSAPKMLVNTAFVETFAETPEKLLMLVMHELHHVLLGHTRLFERPTPAHNLVFDAVINSMLCRMFPDPPYTSMVCDLYRADRFPECLLRPPDHWKPEKDVTIPRGLKQPGMERAQEVYRALYSETGADYYELFEALISCLKQADLKVVLLGDHSGEIPDLMGTGMLFDCVREIVERWPQPPNPIAGRSLADRVAAVRVTVKRDVTDRAALTWLIRQVAKPRPDARGRLHGGGLEEALCLSPRPDRRSLVLRTLGQRTLLHRVELASPNSRTGIEPVHVYVDVSGSVAGLRNTLYGAVAACREVVNPAVHLFSTVVHDVPMRRFLAGECSTTGGTSIECVAEHIRANKVRRAVLLTDGWVGRATGRHSRTLHECHLGVALTPGGGSRADLKEFVKHWIELKGRP